MNTIQVYLQGARHKAKNQPCEDRTYCLEDNGVKVISLADGAGSSKYTHSAQGAECATKAISQFFCNNFDKFYAKKDVEELAQVIKTVCQKALQDEAQKIGVEDVGKLSSTLLCVAVKENKVVVCHIGDGVIGKLTSKGTQVISAPDNGEFASTTYFITNPLADKHIKILKGTTDNVVSYFLMSDGTAEYIYDEHNNKFLDAARKMALMPFESNGQEKLEKTILEFMINKDINSDDCSFICMLIEKEIPLNKQQGNVEAESELKCYKDFNSNQEKITNTKPFDVNNNQKSVQKNKSTKLVIIISVCVLLLVAIAVAFNVKNLTQKNETTKQTTITYENKIAETKSGVEGKLKK